MTTPSSDVCRPLPEQAGRSGSGDGGRAQDGGPGRGALGDRYELVSLLTTGGMGQVWRARDTLLDRPVAVTVLRSEFTGDPTFVARFRAEARHTAVLAHRNIAALHDYERPSNGNGKGSARGNGRGKANGCGQG